MTTARKLGLLACLYLSQGLPYGFFTQGLPALMRTQHISLGKIGLTTLLMLPWALKFLWAPYVDRHGRRRAWILPLQIGAALGLVGIGALDWRAELPWVLACVAGVTLLSATQDIATDALAVDLLAPAERGLGNGVQVAGYRLGMVVGGGVVLMLLDRLDWKLAFELMAGLLLLATLPIALFRERTERVAATTAPATWPALVEHFRRPGAVRWAALLALYKSFEAMAGPMIKPLMIDRGYTPGDVGAILGTAGSLAALAGAMAGGWGVRAFGRRRALLGFGLLHILALAGYALPSLEIGGPRLLTSVVVFEHFFGSTATAAVFTLMMDACRPGRAATDYTIQACVVVVATGVASALSGFSADAFGYAGHFVATAVLSLVELGVVARLLGSAPVTAHLEAAWD